MPFIDMLNTDFDVINLSSIDYRLLNSMGMDSYYYPIGTPETNANMEKMWN